MNRKRKPCKFCKDDRIIVTNNERSIRIELDAAQGTISIRRHIDSPILVKMPFDFCPVCGRRVTPIKI